MNFSQRLNPSDDDFNIISYSIYLNRLYNLSDNEDPNIVKMVNAVEILYTCAHDKFKIVDRDELMGVPRSEQLDHRCTFLNFN